MKAVIFLISAVMGTATPNYKGKACTKAADCESTAVGELEECCMIGRSEDIETKLCNLKSESSTKKKFGTGDNEKEYSY